MNLRRNLIFFLIFIFSLLQLVSTALWAEDLKTYPDFNLQDWPAQIIKNFEQKIPEIRNKKFSEIEINYILKKVNSLYPFENLKILQKNNHLYLVGLQTSHVTAVVYNVSSNVNIDELKTTAPISLVDAESDVKISQVEEKINSYLKNQGYRNSKVISNYQTNENLSRTLVFQIELGAKTIISQISVNGLNSRDQKELESSIYWYGVGDVLSDDKIKIITQQLRLFLSQRGFYLVATPPPQIYFNTTDTEARLVFKLQNRSKYFVEILGAKNYSNLFLTSEILKLGSYSSSENNFGAELSEKLRSFYLDKGFSRFEITYYERKDNDRIVLTLNMEEGSKTLIQNFYVIGQLSRPEKYYLDQFVNLSSQKIQDNIWFRPDAEQAGKNLVTSLQNEGFISAKLDRIEASVYSAKRNRIDVSVSVEEGLQTQIENIEFKNNNYFSKKTLLEKMNLNDIKKLNLTDLEKGLLKLKLFYAENGFIEIQILNEKQKTSENLITYSPDLTKAQILIDLREGTQVSVGSIVLDGNKLSQDKLILTELDFKQGDILTPQKIDESISRLQKTGHFTSIQIYTLERDSSVKERTVVVKLNERKPILLTAGIGATNENERTFHAYLGAAHRNLGGWGRGVSLRGETSYNDVFLKFIEYKVSAGYLEPYLFDTRTRFRLNYTTQVSVSDVILRKQTISNSAVWAVEQDFTSHITGLWDIYNITNYVEKGMTVDDERIHGYSGQDFEIALTGPTLDIDYRDQVLNPQKGSFSRFTLEYASAALGSHKVDDFIRATGQTTWYLPLNDNKIVWANSVRGGYAALTEAANFGVPFDKKGFILGGRSTIRGFESNEFFPNSSDKNPEKLTANYKFTTPISYQLIKSELRFPLFAKHDISAAVFYDGGQILIDGVNFTDSYRDAIGIGFRYATPVGPLNLEYAQKLDKKPYESEGAFHLSVGVF